MLFTVYLQLVTKVIHCYHSNKNMTVLEALLVTSQRSGTTLDFGEYYKQFSEVSVLHIVRVWRPEYGCVPSLDWNIGLPNLKVQLLVSRLSTVYLYMRYVRSISDAINDYLVTCAKPIAHSYILSMLCIHTECLGNATIYNYYCDCCCMVLCSS